MSERSESLTPGQLEVEHFLTVFEGSSREDVSHARQLWSSLSLLPPQESRLVSADIRQRLPVSRPQQQQQQQQRRVIEPVPSLDKELREERRRYEAMAETRRQIMALLRRQREQRVHKELLSQAFKPRLKQDSEGTRDIQDRAERERDRELVQQLQ